MNLSILILPALLGTLAASAAHTLPADLRHDAADKAPLTVARMAVARGAGSTCALGCNEPNVACAHDDTTMTRYYGQDWNPHQECTFAFGSDTCSAGPDMLCNATYYFNSCSSPAYEADYTYSSTCTISVPPGGTG